MPAYRLLSFSRKQVLAQHQPRCLPCLAGGRQTGRGENEGEKQRQAGREVPRGGVPPLRLQPKRGSPAARPAERGGPGNQQVNRAPLLSGGWAQAAGEQKGRQARSLRKPDLQAMARPSPRRRPPLQQKPGLGKRGAEEAGLGRRSYTTHSPSMWLSSGLPLGPLYKLLTGLRGNHCRQTAFLGKVPTDRHPLCLALRRPSLPARRRPRAPRVARNSVLAGTCSAAVFIAARPSALRAACLLPLPRGLFSPRLYLSLKPWGEWRGQK